MKKVLLLTMSVLASSFSFGQKKYEMVVEKTDGTSSVFNTEEVARTYFRERSQGDISCPDANHPHMIDLGIGTLWTCCNVGASSPEQYGGYYAWGETHEKAVYTWDTYQYGYYNYNYDGDYSHLVNIGSDISGTQYDAATANWGAPWRMPTLDEIKKLLDNCDSEWTTENGVYGRRLTSKINRGSIFLPAAGYRWDSGLYDAGYYGDYWSSTLHGSYPVYAYGLDFASGYTYWNGWDDRGNGQSVRPVR